MKMTAPHAERWQKNETLRGLVAWFGRRTQPMPWFTMPVAAFLITRFAILIGGYLGEIVFVSPESPELWHAAPDNLLLDMWARWDSGFYLDIVTNGYAYTGQGMSNVAFFPVYPLLTSLTTVLVRDPLPAGIIVSNLALLGALLYLYQLTRLEFNDDETAARTVFYIASFPTAFFFSAVYTESTFLLFSVATMYHARRQQWGLAAVMGLLAAGTRIVGVSLAAVVLLEWLRVHGWTLATCFKASAWRGLWLGLKQDWVAVAFISLIPLGLLSYMLFLQLQFQDPLAFMTVQAAWKRENLGPVTIISRELGGLLQQDLWAGDIWWHVVLDLSCFALAMFMMVVAWFRLGEHYAILIALGMLIPVSSSTQSLSRYLLVLFPVFMMLGWYGRHVLLDRTLMVFFNVLLGIATAIFTNWIFIA